MPIQEIIEQFDALKKHITTPQGKLAAKDFRKQLVRYKKVEAYLNRISGEMEAMYADGIDYCEAKRVLKIR